MAVLWSNQLRWYVGAFDLSTATTRSSVTLQSPALDRTVYSLPAEVSQADVRRDEAEWAGLFEDGSRGLEGLIGTLIGTVGQMMSFVIGTTTGDRAYCGTVGVMAMKPEARLGDLVRVVGNFKPDKQMLPSVHYGPSQVTTADGTSGTHDASTASTGNFVLFVHVFRLTGTLTVNLQHSAAGTIWTDVATATATFTATGSTAIEVTSGTLLRRTHLKWVFSSATGSSDIFGALDRSRTSA